MSSLLQNQPRSSKQRGGTEPTAERRRSARLALCAEDLVVLLKSDYGVGAVDLSARFGELPE